MWQYLVENCFSTIESILVSAVLELSVRFSRYRTSGCGRDLLHNNFRYGVDAASVLLVDRSARQD